MRTYIRETQNLGNGKRMITHYTLEDYMIHSIVKFFLFLFIVWPIQIMFWITFYLIKWTFKAFYWVVSLPFRLLFRKKND